MTKTNPKVDPYFTEGCGRCPLVSTPQCKVNTWREELLKLRAILLGCGLTEELKWKMPCYTFEKRNVVILSAFKDFCSINFVKGVLLKDPANLLTKPGENTQAGRLIRFTSVQQIDELEPAVKDYLQEAIEVEKAGLKAPIQKNPEPIPDELQQKLDENPALKTAFFALTPGRQRGYILHFSQPKQSKTRVSRIEKCMPKILEGKGFFD
ncbi:MAG: hypothetical protein GC154_13450 [bacterium]|nr:hypothetical protein [bacterium]